VVEDRRTDDAGVMIFKIFNRAEKPVIRTQLVFRRHENLRVRAQSESSQEAWKK
jgi:hypothetical protein